MMHSGEYLSQLICVCVRLCKLVCIEVVCEWVYVCRVEKIFDFSVLSKVIILAI